MVILALPELRFIDFNNDSFNNDGQISKIYAYWGVSKLEKNVKICSEQNVNLFGNFSKFVRGVSKLASFCQISINCSIIITIAIMGRSKHTSSQNYAAIGRNLAYYWRGNKKPEECRGWSQRSACGELTKHMNDMSEKTAGTTELSHRS